MWIVIILLAVAFVFFFVRQGTVSTFAKIQRIITLSPQGTHDFFEYMELNPQWRPSGSEEAGSKRILIFDNRMNDAIFEMVNPEAYKRDMATRMPIPYWFIYTGCGNENDELKKMLFFLQERERKREAK